MAGRPRTPIGTWGTINTFQVTTGWEARTRYRDQDGRLRLVSARGTSKAKARNALLRRLAERQATDTTASSIISSGTTVTALCTTWIERKRTEDVTEQTIGDYQTTINNTIHPRIGDITLREATPGRLATFLDSLTPGVRHRTHTILVQAFRLALTHDAVTSNPVANLTAPRRPKDPVRALEISELVALRNGVNNWIAGTIDDNGIPAVKPTPRAPGLDQFVDLLLATGTRPGELAASIWGDITLDSDTPTILINATMVRIPGKGLVRQEWPKSKKGRLLILPPFAVQTIAKMRSQQHNPPDDAPLFPSLTGGHRDPSNIRKQWRSARQAAGAAADDPEMWTWVTFRTMRRTVATIIDRNATDADAAAQLGHGGVEVTRRHYIAARAAQAPDLSNILEKLAG